MGRAIVGAGGALGPPSDAAAPTLAGRVVLVTGAGQGLGRGIALAVAGAGGAAVVTARRRDAAAQVVAEAEGRGGHALAVTCDVTRRADVDAAVAAALDRYGRLDAVVHNATSARSSHPTALPDVTDESWDEQVAVALDAAFHLAQASRAALAATAGSFVVMVSTAGIEGSAPLPVYSAVKGAQRAFVKGLAREWGPQGIRVNGVAPVAVSRAMAEFFEKEPEAADGLARRAALRRLGDAEADIGRAVTFLAGPDSRFVSGQVLVVNGGAFLY